MADDRKAKLAKTNHWDEILTLRDEQREQYAQRHPGDQGIRDCRSK